MSASLCLTGCMTENQASVVGPTGHTMHTAKCNQSPNACYQQASQTCSGTYQVVDSYSKAGGLLADVIPGPITWYYMSYQCGKTDGRTPTFPFRGQHYNPATVVVTDDSSSFPTTVICNDLSSGTVSSTVRCQSY